MTEKNPPAAGQHPKPDAKSGQKPSAARRQRRSRQAAMAVAKRGMAAWQICFVAMNKGVPTERSFMLDLEAWPGVCTIEREQARDFLSFLGIAEIIHLGGDAMLHEIDLALNVLGYLPLDNRRTDIAELVREMNADRQGSMRSFDLATISAHCGLSHAVPDSADALASARHIAKLFALPQLGHRLSSVSEADLAAPTSESWFDSLGPEQRASLDEAPLPDPGIPAAAIAAGPWRTTAWDPEEQRQCAVDFRSGMSLAELSIRFGRKPSAIHARLVRDRVIAAGEAPAPYAIAALF